MAGTIKRGKIIRADLANWDGKTATYSRIDATGGTVSGLPIGNEVDVLQVDGSGTDRTRTTILNCINRIGSTSVTLVFAPGTWTIDDNLTIASNFTCRIPAGCIFNISSGKTLTFNGPVFIESQTWTSGSGTVSPTHESGNAYRTAAERSASVTPTNWFRSPYNVQRYGALGDRTTDDLTAFNTAKAVAVYSKKIYIPPLQAGDYYKLSNVWTLTDLDSVEVYGEGVASLLVIANAAGANCITLDSTVQATIRSIGIYGTSGSGNGIELTNASHHCKLIDIWVGWVDGAGFKNSSGISTTYINCRVDQNNGYRPATLAGGLVDGAADYSFYVPSLASGLNNNPTFIGCQANAAGAVTSVQIGDNGGTPVDSFNWHGGLIQGSSVYKEVYLVTKDAVIEGAHIEPPIGVTANYVATLDACTNTIIRDCSLQGDARFIGVCVQSGFEHVRGCGIDIGTSCDRCFVRDGQYANITTGPAGGLVKDKGKYTDIRDMVNSANARYAVGESIRNPTTYFQTNMEDWVGTSVPCGFSSFGTPTITRESSVIRSGTYSAKVVHSSQLDEGLTITLLPINQIAGRRVTVEAWVYNLTTAGIGYISSIESGSSTYHHPSFQADTWERMVVTFDVSSGATAFAIRLNGLVGTAYWDSVKITVEEHTPIKEMTLDGTATPSVSYGGRPVPLLITSGTPTITNFLDPHVGVPFTIRFAGATVITDGDPIFLNGSGNLTGAAGDTLSLIYDSAGKFREIGRAVV